MNAIYPSEVCTMCGNYLDDDMKCYECEDCNGEKMTDTITVTSDVNGCTTEETIEVTDGCQVVVEDPTCLWISAKYQL